MANNTTINMEKFMNKIREYGIEEGLVPFTHDLEILKKLSPDKYIYAISDPPEIKKDIIKYDFYIDTGIDTGYMKGRRWDLFMALREIIQNALDAQEAADRPLNEIEIYTEKNMIHIRDYGSGIKLRHFRIGATDKVCWHRGYYGEGMKVSALYFLINGIGFYVFTGNKVYKLTLFDNKHMVIIVGFSRKVINGTDVVLCFNKIAQTDLLKKSVDNLNNITFQQYMKKISKYNPKTIDITVNGTISEYELYKNCKHERKITVVLPDNIPKEYQGLLFVGDIYVGKIKDATGYDSKFTYNMWFIELEPNRKQVKDREKFSDLVFELINKSDDFAEYIVNNLFKTKHINVSGYLMPLVIEPEHVLETGAQSFAIYMFKLSRLLEKRYSDMKICYVRGIEVNSIQAYAYQTSFKYRFLSLYTPYLESNYSSHFDSVTKVLEKIFEEDKTKNKEGDIETENLRILDVYILSVLNAIKDTILYMVLDKEDFTRKRVPIIKLNNKLEKNTLGTYTPKENIIRINYDILKSIGREEIKYEPVKTITNIYEEPFFEEFSHAYGYKIMEIKAADISKALEKAMSKVAALTFKLTTSAYRDYLNMALLGLYYDSVIYKDFYTTDYLQKIYYRILGPYSSIADFVERNANKKFNMYKLTERLNHNAAYPLMKFITVETIDDIKKGGEEHKKNENDYTTFSNKYYIISFDFAKLGDDVEPETFVKIKSANVFKDALLYHISDMKSSLVKKYIEESNIPKNIKNKINNNTDKLYVSFITIFYDFNNRYYKIYTSIAYDKLQEIEKEIDKLYEEIKESTPERKEDYMYKYIRKLRYILNEYGTSSYYKLSEDRTKIFEIDYLVYSSLYEKIKNTNII